MPTDADVIDVTPSAPTEEAPAAAPGCSCGVGDKPRTYHDDDCDVWEGAYVRPEDAIERRDPEAPHVPVLMDPDALGRAPTAVGSATVGLSVIPPATEMRDLAALANTLAMADACPRPLRQKPNDVFLVLLSARDLGVALTTALREFHVIEGRVTLSPKVKLAMVRSRPDLGRVRPGPENGALGAVWYSTRSDSGGVTVASEFTWADAQMAHLVDSRCTPYEHWSAGSGNSRQKCLCKDNWKNWPKRMVSWRALGYLLDDEYPEIGTGLYSPDELGAITDADGEPIPVTGVEALPGMKRPRGQSAPGAPADEVDTDPAADPELLASLIARTEVVKLHPEANDELRAWWTEREMPKIAELRQRQTTTLNARLSFLETKFELITNPPTAGEPQKPETGGEAPTAEEPPAAPEIDQEPPRAADPEPTPEAEIGEQVTGKAPEPTADPENWVPTEPDGDLAGWLIARANGMSAAEVKTAYTLAGLEPPSGNVQALRKAWARWQFALHANAVCYLLALGFVGACWTLPDATEITG